MNALIRDGDTVLGTHTFANAVALEEALIDKGGERGTVGGISTRPDAGFSHATTSPCSRDAIRGRRRRCGCTPTILHLTKPDLTIYPADHPGFGALSRVIATSRPARSCPDRVSDQRSRAARNALSSRARIVAGRHSGSSSPAGCSP
jgi:hypothetical protein